MTMVRLELLPRPFGDFMDSSVFAKGSIRQRVESKKVEGMTALTGLFTSGSSSLLKTAGVRTSHAQGYDFNRLLDHTNELVACFFSRTATEAYCISLCN